MFGPTCVLCGLATGEFRICDPCLGVLPWNDCICERCGQPQRQARPDGVTCAACQQRSPVFTYARAPLLYAFPVDNALKKLKYRHQLMYAPAFADLLLTAITTEFPDSDALVPVPLHRWRHITRGFNQADELARPLSRHSGLPVIKTVVRTKLTRSQSGLSARDRLKNMRDAFMVRGALSCRYPVIIDDVITTGATCNQLASALIKAGAEKVGVLTVAHSGTVPGTT